MPCVVLGLCFFYIVATKWARRIREGNPAAANTNFIKEGLLAKKRHDMWHNDTLLTCVYLCLPSCPFNFLSIPSSFNSPSTQLKCKLANTQQQMEQMLQEKLTLSQVSKDSEGCAHVHVQECHGLQLVSYFGWVQILTVVQKTHTSKKKLKTFVYVFFISCAFIKFSLRGKGIIFKICCLHVCKLQQEDFHFLSAYAF